MDIPRCLTLFGCLWTVELMPGLISTHSKYGLTNFCGNTIQVESSLAVDVQWAVLVHEVLHIVNDSLALGLDEDTITRLDAGLGQFVLQLVGSADSPQ